MASNSTTTPLVIGGTFSGAWEKRLTNCFLDVSIFASTNTLLYIQQSSNASQITNNDLYSYLTPGTAAIHQQPLVLEYFRVVVTNSSAATQTYLREIARLNNVNISNGVALDPQPVSGTVDVGNFPATQAVTGDFYQATQPVSIAAPVAVTGDFYPATQPVSGSVSLLAAADPTLCVGTVRLTDVYGQGLVTTAGNLMVGINNIYTSNPLHTILDSGSVNITGSVAVTGDFYQATQPVSIAAPVAVTGDFYQATQPVSGTVDVGNFPAEQVVDVSGVVVTSSQHLNNLNATYAAGAVVGNIISASPETNIPYVGIELSSSPVFTIGQQVVISGATTFPGLNGVRTITEIVSSTVFRIYFEGLTGSGNDVPETGIMRSFGSSPLQADSTGNLLVKVEGTAAVSVSGDVSVVQKTTTLAYRNIATSNTGDVVSAVPATIRQFCAQNSAATNQYVKLYNLSGIPTSSDTPIFTFLLGSATGIVANVILNHTFSVGIGIRATLLPADNDNTAATNFVFTNLTYST